MTKLKFASPAAAAAAAALMTLASSHAMATIVCNTAPFGATLPFTVPATIDGVYVNLVTGVGQTVAPFTAGWDFNPYAATGPLFNFFWTPAGIGGLLTGGVYAASPVGVSVGPAGTYGTGAATAAQMAQWRAGQTNMYIGMRFTNEATAVINYGWVKMTTTGPTTGFPATINQFCYQNDGTAILTGSTLPVSLQSFSVD
jgi:hypothetical protein